MLVNGATILVQLLCLQLVMGKLTEQQECHGGVGHKFASTGWACPPGRNLLIYPGDNRTAEEKLMGFGIESFGRILFNGRQTPCGSSLQSASTTGGLISLCGTLDVFDSCLENKTVVSEPRPQFFFFCEERTCLLVMSVKETKCLLKKRAGLVPKSKKNGECFFEGVPDSASFFEEEEPAFFAPIGSQELPQCVLAAPEGTVFLRKLICREGKVRVQLKAILGGEEPLGGPGEFFYCVVDGKCAEKGFRADFICYEEARTSNLSDSSPGRSVSISTAMPEADSPSGSDELANSAISLLQILLGLLALIILYPFG